MEDLGARIEEILREELGDAGPFVLRKQCEKLRLDPRQIAPEDLPRLSSAISEAMTLFGSARAKAVHDKVRRLGKVDDLIHSQANPHTRMNMAMDLAKASQNSGDWADALAKYDEAESIAKGLKFWGIVAGIERDRSGILLRLGRHEDAEQSALRSMEISKRISNKEAIAKADRALGNVYWRKGEYARAKGHMEGALHVAQMSGLRDVEAGAYMGLANIHDEQGMYDAGIDFGKKALEILDKTGDGKGAATMHNNLGVAYARKGDFRTAADYYEKCVELCRKLGYVSMEGWSLFNLAECYAETGRVDEAVERCKESEVIFKRLRDDLGMSGVHMAYAIAYRSAKKWPESKRHFEKTLAIREKLAMPYRLADAKLEFAVMLLSAGDRAAAASMARESAEIFGRLGNKVMAARAEELIAKASERN